MGRVCDNCGGPGPFTRLNVGRDVLVLCRPERPDPEKVFTTVANCSGRRRVLDEHREGLHAQKISGPCRLCTEESINATANV